MTSTPPPVPKREGYPSVYAAGALPLRVMFVDDSAVLRRSLRMVLSGVPNLLLVGEACTAEEAIEMLWRSQPDVLILDMRLPGRSGLDILPELHAKHPNMVVIMFTLSASPTMADQCYRAGAKYFFDKAQGVTPLLKVLRQLASGPRS